MLTEDEFNTAYVDFVRSNYCGNETELSWRWETGGMSGGNCWGDNATSYSTSKQEPDPSPLDELLAIVAPSITFLQYKRLMKFVQQTSQSYGEYYGNYTYYAVKSLQKTDLFKFLVEIECVSSS